jgi:hypothetical protein
MEYTSSTSPSKLNQILSANPNFSNEETVKTDSNDQNWADFENIFEKPTVSDPTLDKNASIQNPWDSQVMQQDLNQIDNSVDHSKSKESEGWANFDALN